MTFELSSNYVMRLKALANQETPDLANTKYQFLLCISSGGWYTKFITYIKFTGLIKV